VSLRGEKQQRKVEGRGIIGFKTFSFSSIDKTEKKFKVSSDFPFVLLRKIVE
jgi:hypothetical protein